MHAVVDACEIKTSATTDTAETVPDRPCTITTTLYDLIAAIQTTVEPHDDDLIVATVWHLLRSGRLTWQRHQAPRLDEVSPCTPLWEESAEQCLRS
jgi:hypothetical protein